MSADDDFVGEGSVVGCWGDGLRGALFGFEVGGKVLGGHVVCECG